MGSIHVYWKKYPEHSQEPLVPGSRECVCKKGSHVSWQAEVDFRVDLSDLEKEELRLGTGFIYLWQSVRRVTSWILIDPDTGATTRGVRRWFADEWYKVAVKSGDSETFDGHSVWMPRNSACAIYSRTRCYLEAYRHVQTLTHDRENPVWVGVHGDRVASSAMNQVTEDGRTSPAVAPYRPFGRIESIPAKTWGFDASVYHCLSDRTDDPWAPGYDDGPRTPGGEDGPGPVTPSGGAPWWSVLTVEVDAPWPTSGSLPAERAQEEGLDVGSRPSSGR